MYEELVGDLRYCDKGDCNGCRRHTKETRFCYALLREAADAIEELSLVAESNERSAARWAEMAEKAVEQILCWIPVTERLPRYGDWVLGIGPKKGYHVCEYRGITHFPYSGDIPWFSAKGRSLTITHWMPLPPAPEPPKEEA